MTEAREWSYDGTELAWLQAELKPGHAGTGHVVAQIVPGGFEAYLRVFHRFEASDGSGLTRTWRARAQDAGVRFHAEMSHWALPDEGRTTRTNSDWLAETGHPDPVTRQALARVLGRTVGDQPVFFAYDLAALLWGEDTPLVRRAPLADLEAMREGVAAAVGNMDGPEFWWPQDRSWVVTSDHDLLSTYVGCSAEVAERILDDGEIEALPVTSQTRVDWYADETIHCHGLSERPQGAENAAGGQLGSVVEVRGADSPTSPPRRGRLCRREV